MAETFSNTVGKGEIPCDEQFLLFPQCFQMACFPGASKGVIVWEWVNTQSRLLMTLQKKGTSIFSFFCKSVFYSIKERNCHFKNVCLLQILSIPQCQNFVMG